MEQTHTTTQKAIEGLSRLMERSTPERQDAIIAALELLTEGKSEEKGITTPTRNDSYEHPEFAQAVLARLGHPELWDDSGPTLEALDKLKELENKVYNLPERKVSLDDRALCAVLGALIALTGDDHHQAGITLQRFMHDTPPRTLYHLLEYMRVWLMCDEVDYYVPWIVPPPPANERDIDGL
jgi:hypothetical protein